MGLMGLFGGRKAEKPLTSGEALQEIRKLVSSSDFNKLQDKLRGVSVEHYHEGIKRWACDHQDPEVKKIGRLL